MDYLSILKPIILTILTALIPYFAVLLRRVVVSTKDKNRAVEYDTIAESILNLIQIQNPKWDIVEDIDKFKDELLEQVLADPRSTNNRLIAERVAARALVKVRDGS